MKNLRRSAGWILAVILGNVTAFAQDGPPGPPPTAVHVVPAREESLQARRQVTGELRAVARSHVATYEEGVITELHARAGSRVRAGDVIAVLDARRLKLELRRLNAMMAVADARISARAAELEMQQSDLTAHIELSVKGAGNPKELSDARLLVTAAEAQKLEEEEDRAVLAAAAALMQTRLDDTQIKAPFDGVVVQRLTEVGQWVGSGDAIAELVSLGSYEVWLDVPQRLAPAFAGSGPVALQVRIDATEQRAVLPQAVVVPRVDSRARSFQVYALMLDDADRLKPGMSVTGWIPTGEVASYLTVPRDALVRGQVGFFVYVASKPAKGPSLATPVPVTLLFDIDGRVAVQSERLGVGDDIVVEGNERLFPMKPITPVRIEGGQLGNADTPESPAPTLDTLGSGS